MFGVNKISLIILKEVSYAQSCIYLIKYLH